MAAMVLFHTEDESFDYTPVAATPAGTLVQIGGRVGLANNDIAANQKGSVRTLCVVRIVNSGVAFADGASVGYDATTGKAVAAGGGTFNCGKAVGAWPATAGAIILVVLNQ